MSIVPADTRAEMVRLYVEGTSSEEIARRTFWGSSTVRRVLQQEGVELRRWSLPPRFTLTQEDLDQVVELYQRGLSTIEIGRALGLHRTTVAHRIRRAGLPQRSRGEAQQLARRLAVSQGGALTARQAAALRFVEQNNPTTAAAVTRALGIPVHRVRVVLAQLESYGLLSHKRKAGWPSAGNEWKRTDLALLDVLDHAVTPPPQRREGDVWLPVQPIRDYLARHVALERRKATVEGDALKIGRSVVCQRVGLDGRRLYALTHEQESVTLSLADQILSGIGDGTRLEDLWPELAVTGEVVELPRKPYRKLEAAA